MWSGGIIIIAMTSANVIYGAWQIHSAGPQYTATMSIAPAESDVGVGGGASGILAQFTDSSSVSVPKFTQFLAAMSVIEVAKILDVKYGMFCKVYKDDCDQITDRRRGQTGNRASFSGLLASIGGLPNPNAPRTTNDLASYVDAKIKNETNKKNSIVLLKFSHSSPEFAKEFLSSVVAATNDYIKTLNRETNRRYVSYLNQAVAKSTNIAQRQVLDALLLQQERQMMLTEVDVPYAATTLDGPSVTPVNHVLKTLLVHAFIGFILGAIIANFRHQLRLKWRF